MEDPFELDQRSLDSKLKLLQENFDRWRRIKSGADALTSPEELADAEDEFQWLTNEIEKSVKSLGWELDDLGETLRLMATQQPAKKGPASAAASRHEARAQYIGNTRDLLSVIGSEVKAGKARVADAADGGDGGNAFSEPSPSGPPSQPIGAQNNGEGMSASTERLVQSLLQQEEEDDDDVELLIRDEARRQFSISVDGEETPLRRLWRRHKPLVVFVGLVLLLLLIILIISVSKGSHHPEVPGGSGTAETTFTSPSH